MLANDRLLVLGLFFYPIETPVSVNLLFFYLLLVAGYAACFLAAFKAHGGFLRNLLAIAKGDQLPRIPNWLVVMPLASSALLIVVLLITFVQDWLGVPTGSLPPVAPSILLYSLTYSPILEEWTFRLSPIGLVVALRILFAKGPQSSSLLSFILPERAKAEAGLPRIYGNGWKGIHWSEWLALVMTSIVFGLAHVLAGGGWEIGKITTATVSGLVLGASFLAYGGYAAVLLHWFFNFYFEIFALGSTLVGGILDIAATLVSLLTIAVGIIGLTLATRFLLFGRQSRVPSPQ